MRILVFGDSIAQGYWDSEGGWVARLRKHYDTLQIQDIHSDQPAIFNLSVSGDKSASVLKRLEAETKARMYRAEAIAFTFQIGANDSYQEGKTLTPSPENYLANLQQIIKLARQFSDKILFVGMSACDEKLTTPVFWRNISWTNDRLRLFENALSEICEKQGVAFTPIFEKFQKALKNGQDLLTAGDGLHPNNNGHEFIAGLVKPELEKLLR